MAVTVHTDATLFRVGNDSYSTLTADINTTQTTIPVADSSKFRTTGGYAAIVSTDAVTPGVELVKYTGLSASGNNLTGVTRGAGGTTALNADSGDTVEERVIAEHHNALLDGLKTTSQDLSDLTDGTEVFSKAKWQTVVGSVTHNADIAHDGSGDLWWTIDQTSDLYVKFGTSSPAYTALRMTGDATEAQLAVTNFKGYPRGQIGVGGQLGWDFQPGVADGGSAVAFDFLAINDLASAGALVARFQNNGTPIMSVGKSLTTVPSLECSTGVLRLPAFTSAPSSPADDDVWIQDVGGTRELKVRIGGTTYGVTLT